LQKFIQNPKIAAPHYFY